MKKIIILAIAFIFASTMSFAATASKEKVAEKEMTGKVKTVSVADPVKGTKSEVKVIDEKSKEMTFLLKATTTLYGADSKAITLDKLKADEKVMVKYETTKEGVHEADSIHLLK